MKKLAVLTLSVAGILSLSSFTKTKEQQQKHIATWVVTCADGSYGGSFTCNCSQGQANAIAHIMC